MKPVRFTFDVDASSAKLDNYYTSMQPLWERMGVKMPSAKKPQIDRVQTYESSSIWILPSGLAINRNRIMFVTPPKDPSGKILEDMTVVLEVGDQAVSLKIEHPKDRTALRQAILALGVEIG